LRSKPINIETSQAAKFEKEFGLMSKSKKEIAQQELAESVVDRAAKILASQAAWRAKNKDKVTGYQKKWRSANSDKVKSAHKRYQERNTEKVKEWHRKAAAKRQAMLAEAKAVLEAKAS
jgi:hypothetical protein